MERRPGGTSLHVLSRHVNAYIPNDRASKITIVLIIFASYVNPILADEGIRSDINGCHHLTCLSRASILGPERARLKVFACCIVPQHPTARDNLHPTPYGHARAPTRAKASLSSYINLLYCHILAHALNLFCRAMNNLSSDHPGWWAGQR
jgi:hypothetical protein